MAFFDGFDSPSFTRQLSRQIASLSRDAGHLSNALGRYTHDARHDAGRMAHDFADDAIHHGAAAARVLGKEAWKASKAVRKDPLPAVMAITALACVARMVMSSPKSQRRTNR